MTSFLPIPTNSDFTLSNIPFGVFRTSSLSPRICIAIGSHLLDLRTFHENSGFRSLQQLQVDSAVFSAPNLNAFAALPRLSHNLIRAYLISVLTTGGPFPDLLENNTELQKKCLHKLEDVTMCLPMEIGDYTDFYAGRVHAYNVGCLFRGPENALQKNYEQLPVGYHGRASSVVVSGTDIRRPRGQTGEGVFGECQRLDIELEMAALIARGNNLGEPVSTQEAREMVFGYVLMNDWSARDVQAWEYVPLGPFTAKNFATTISPWVVLPIALEEGGYMVQGLERWSKTPVQPYLQEEGENMIGVHLEVKINGETMTKTNGKNLLWSFNQMIAHHTVTGCNMRTGDLLGSGTISGEGEGEKGCLLEATSGGKNPVKIGGEEKTWLKDGDEVVIMGHCGDGDKRVGWGECRGKILPAKPLK
ncbi:fumarylacetoacetate hydrolase FahA [Pyronema omphalodes]|nr:fumarylacetoacetate hydrolase FahA [Pyronema omphalodes]